MTTQYWITGTAGDWSTAADWVSGVVPTSTADAVIINSNAVSVSGTAVANSLILNNSILTDSGTLTLGTSLTLDGGAVLALSGGTLSAQSITSDSGSNGGLSGYGTISVSGAVSGDFNIYASGGTLKVLQGSLAGGNFFIIDSGATLELSNGTALAVNFEGPAATLKLDTPAAFTGAIQNTAVGDIIDLAGITASSANYNNGSLTINETNGQQFTYGVSGSLAGYTVTIASDNSGGTLVYWVQPSISTTVTSISAATDNHATDLDAGHLVTITVSTSEVVTVKGIPTLPLNDNEVATYTSGSGTNALTFTYTVQPGDNIADLRVTGLNLPLGATIQDAIGNNLSGGVTGDLGIQIDTTAPAVAITSTGGLINNPTQTVSGTVDVGDAGTLVTLYDGTTALGTATVQANGSWSDTIALTGNGTHTLTAEDTDAAGNTGTSNAVVYTLNTVAPTTSPTVEHITATANNHASIVSGGDVVTITVNVSEPVAVVGVPALLLNDSGAALYTGGSGTSTLTFEYAVQPSDSTSDLTVAGLYLPPGASIQDAANNPLPTVAGDLGLQVNASAPSNTTVSYTFATLNNPSASAYNIVYDGTISNNGQVVGYYDAINGGNSFLYSNGTYTTLAFPLAQDTWAYGINNLGQIVGQYEDSSGVVHGFLFSNGTYTTLDDPSATSSTGTGPVSINDNGQVLGNYGDASGSHSFIYTNGTFTPIAIVDPFAPAGANTSLYAINNEGQILGGVSEYGGLIIDPFIDSNGTFTKLPNSIATLAITDNGEVVGNLANPAGAGISGFLFSNGTYTTLNDPSALHGTTIVSAINNIDQIIGNFTNANGVNEGFLYSGGNFTSINSPLGTDGTYLQGINDLGQILGYYIDSSGTHEFIANPPAPQATTIQQEIAGLYAAVYDRAADLFGMQYWVNVVSQQADALGITYSAAANTPISTNDAALLGQLFVSTQSAYFNQTYGNLNDADFVNALYFNMGGQNAKSASSIAYWVNIIQNEEASGLSVQNARAAVVGQFVHDLIDVNLAQWTTILTPSELETTILRQAVVDNKLAVSLAYLNASAGLGGSILNAHAVGDAGFQAEVRALSGVAIDPSTATVQITGINHAVADQNLMDIQPV